jgi:hypothetical protein
MRLDLRAETEVEPPLRVRLQIPTEVGDGHGVACERDGDAGADFEPRRVFGGQQHGQERIVIDLACPASVVPGPFQIAD